jgi:hypothetical protein
VLEEEEGVGKETLCSGGTEGYMKAEEMLWMVIQCGV